MNARNVSKRMIFCLVTLLLLAPENGAAATAARRKRTEVKPKNASAATTAARKRSEGKPKSAAAPTTTGRKRPQAKAESAAAAARRRQKILDERPRNAVSLEFEYETFGGSFTPWSLAAAELSHRFDFGSVIGRINQARRFNQSGTQFEVDAYPRIGRGMYLYANAGASQQRIFPRTRFGAELYKSLPNAFEASIGFRQLNFRTANVTLYTGTIAKYSGNNYYVLRPYIARQDKGTSFSGQVMLRTYFASADDYASLTATLGKAPTEDITVDSVNRVGSWNLRAAAQRVLVRNLLLKAQVGYRNEEIRLTAHRRGWSVGTAIQRRF